MEKEKTIRTFTVSLSDSSPASDKIFFNAYNNEESFVITSDDTFEHPLKLYFKNISGKGNWEIFDSGEFGEEMTKEKGHTFFIIDKGGNNLEIVKTLTVRIFNS